jgi:hypothetical protein
MNYRRIRTQSLAFLLVVSFLIPSGLLVLIPTKHVEAQAKCVLPWAAKAASVGTAAATDATLGVLVHSSANAAGATLSGASSFSTFFNDCILKPLAITMARTMVRNISNSIVNWINGGFEGKPGFISDFRGLVTQTADQAIGNFIYGSDLKFLCQPFSVKIRLQLATKYQRAFQEEVRCTLSSITGNVNSFAKNNGGVGWNNWLEITTQPQNNQYGAYLIAESELASRIQSQLDQVNSALNRNGGFLDYKVCDAQASDRETQAEVSERIARANQEISNGDSVDQSRLSPTPRCKTGGRVVTPGSLVNDQAKKVLGGWSDQLNLATEIDQIVGALISHFADKMISGAQGFLGLSSAGGYARSNVSINQALAAGDNLSLPGNEGLDQINFEAENTISTFSDLLSDPQVIEAGVNILEGRTVAIISPTNVSKTNLAAIIDGSTSSLGSVGSAAGGVQSLWVRLDLGESTDVSEVHLWYPAVLDPAETIGTFNVVFSDTESGRDWVSSEQSVSAGSPNPLSVKINRKGRYLTVEKKTTCSENCPPLTIAEIEVIGPASEATATEESSDEEAKVTFGPTDGEVVFGTSSPISIKIPIKTTKNTVLKSLDVNLYSGNRQIGFNSLMTSRVSLKQGGFTRNSYPGTAPGVEFINLSLTPTSETSISILGSTNSNAPLGSYKFVFVMKDGTGEILDTRTVNFVVQ